MNLQETIAAVIELHNLEALKMPMVFEVWEDGEVTITKGGDLYNQRNLHLCYFGNSSKALPFDSLPLKNKMHSRIACLTDEDAFKAHTLIINRSLSCTQ